MTKNAAIKDFVASVYIFFLYLLHEVHLNGRQQVNWRFFDFGRLKTLQGYKTNVNIPECSLL